MLNGDSPDLKFDYPAKLDEEMYLTVLKKTLAKLRYDIYHLTRAKLRQTGDQRLTQEDFEEIVKGQSLDEIKESVFKLYDIPKGDSPKAARCMIKAYLMHSLNELWHNKVVAEQRLHKDIVVGIAGGEL